MACRVADSLTSRRRLPHSAPPLRGTSAPLAARPWTAGDALYARIAGATYPPLPGRAKDCAVCASAGCRMIADFTIHVEKCVKHQPCSTHSVKLCCIRSCCSTLLLMVACMCVAGAGCLCVCVLSQTQPSGRARAAMAHGGAAGGTAHVRVCGAAAPSQLHLPQLRVRGAPTSEA
jgi:hypothetical protein